MARKAFVCHSSGGMGPMDSGRQRRDLLGQTHKQVHSLGSTSPLPSRDEFYFLGCDCGHVPSNRRQREGQRSV